MRGIIRGRMLVGVGLLMLRCGFVRVFCVEVLV